MVADEDGVGVLIGVLFGTEEAHWARCGVQWSGASERGAKRERVGEERGGEEWEMSDAWRVRGERRRESGRGAKRRRRSRRVARDRGLGLVLMVLTVLAKVCEPGNVVRIGLVAYLDL